KVNTSQSKAKKQAGKPLFQAAKGVYNFFIGDNIKTLRNPNASLLAKSVAAIDLIGMAIPGGLLVKSGAKLAIKGAIKASKYLKEPAKAIAREAKKKATEAVDKAWGFAKGIFGGGKKSSKGKGFFDRPMAGDNIGVNLRFKGSNKYQVGAYNDIKGVEGLDAHHVGQKALMKKLVKNYDFNTAPAINVPKLGHTRRGPNGIVSRSTDGINSPRQLLARDIKELRRVYNDIPNSALKELIKLNKKMYPEMRK
ncbi:hypothetical protein, partial [Paenibacillus prosopidis]